MYLLYSAGLLVALLLALPWLLVAPKRRAGFGEKLGRMPVRLRLPACGERCIWVHAVSVGEVLAVSRLVTDLREETSRRVVVSTTTASGAELARERFGEENVFYFPFDFAFAIRPYLRSLHPELVVLVESELWPNFLRLGKVEGARIAVVNARISDRSLPRYLTLKFLWRGILRNIDLFLARSAEDEQRLKMIGANAGRVKTTGNLKFDITTSRDLPIVHDLRKRAHAASHVVICGSTAPDEEPLLLAAFKVVLAKHPTALLILAPRHPERFDAVAELVRDSGQDLWRRSRLEPGKQLAGGVLLLDSIGELAALYALATVAFVGGSLAPLGGHNILEPAQHGIPIVVGPHTQNFRDIVEIFKRENAVRIVAPEELTAAFLDLLANPAEQKRLGARAASIFRAEAGATRRTLEALRLLLPTSPGELSPHAPAKAAR